MRHLIVSREYPPAPYPQGGIGVYVTHMARLLAERGETVHVIGQRWEGAPRRRESLCDDRLIIHRIGKTELPPNSGGTGEEWRLAELASLTQSSFPNQWFSWHAAFLAEKLIEEEAIDIVEGQEWEAPLYYLMLRRALGLGPERQPPCIVHLHSPSEFIMRFSGVDLGTPEVLTVKRLEDYCIRAADALLCPSKYLGRSCERHYGLPTDSIKILPHPIGATQLLPRSAGTWTSGSICYVGRLEPRKGVIEWVAAAARVAAVDPSVHFDFVGAESWLSRSELTRSIPPHLLRCFRFHGSRPRSELPRYLRHARAAVVPSRWENFPNTCIEAMGSGLPIIATRLGGMAEMVEDGGTGWLTPDTGLSGMVDGLADALRRCLATSPAQREAMGFAASDAIRRLCDNERTTSEHLAFRTEVARRVASRSHRLPDRPSESDETPPNTVRSAPITFQTNGIGVVIRAERLGDVTEVLECLRRQSAPACVVVVVCQEAPSASEAALTRRIEGEGVSLLVAPTPSAAVAWNAGFAARPKSPEAAAWIFLDRHDRLLPDCLERIGSVLARCPEVGIVSFWTGWSGSPTQVDTAPCPALPYQWTSNEVGPASAFRADVLDLATPFRPGLPLGFGIWHIANAALVEGWSAVTYPTLLARREVPMPRLEHSQAAFFRAARAELLQSFMAAIGRDTPALIDLYLPVPLSPAQPQGRSFHAQARRFKLGLLHPRRAIRAVARRLGARLAARRAQADLDRRP